MAGDEDKAGHYLHRQQDLLSDEPRAEMGGPDGLPARQALERHSGLGLMVPQR